jgi:hypothetical protein
MRVRVCVCTCVCNIVKGSRVLECTWANAKHTWEHTWVVPPGQPEHCVAPGREYVPTGHRFATKDSESGVQ